MEDGWLGVWDTVAMAVMMVKGRKEEGRKKARSS